MVKKAASDRLTSGTSLKTRRHGNLYEQEFNFHYFHPVVFRLLVRMTSGENANVLVFGSTLCTVRH